MYGVAKTKSTDSAVAGSSGSWHIKTRLAAFHQQMKTLCWTARTGEGLHAVSQCCVCWHAFYDSSIVVRKGNGNFIVEKKRKEKKQEARSKKQEEKKKRRKEEKNSTGVEVIFSFEWWSNFTAGVDDRFTVFVLSITVRDAGRNTSQNTPSI